MAIYAAENARLGEILNMMRVPPDRKNDLRWVGRNLGIQNHNHADFDEACVLLRRILGPSALIIGEKEY